MDKTYEYFKQMHEREVENNIMKLFEVFREEEEKKLEQKVKGMNPEEREKYLTKQASYYLAMDRYCRFIYGRWRDK